jgi:hypothetical protein
MHCADAASAYLLDGVGVDATRRDTVYVTS